MFYMSVKSSKLRANIYERWLAMVIRVSESDWNRLALMELIYVLERLSKMQDGDSEYLSWLK